MAFDDLITEKELTPEFLATLTRNEDFLKAIARLSTLETDRGYLVSNDKGNKQTILSDITENGIVCGYFTDAPTEEMYNVQTICWTNTEGECSEDWITQIAYKMGKDETNATEKNGVYIRSRQNGSWLEWERLATGGEVSKPNLLINGDFQVWRNGEKFENVTGYTADRWYFASEGTAVKSSVSKTDKGMKISFASGNVSSTPNLTYPIEKSLAKRLSGKTVSVTIRLSATADVNFYTTSVYGLSLSRNANFEVVGDGVARDYTFSARINYTQQTETPKIQFIRLLTRDYVGDINVEYIKMEIGSVPTPFSPKNYAEELALCERYYKEEMAIPYSNPNLLINGDFQVWQRGELFNVKHETRYTADRWITYYANGINPYTICKIQNKCHVSMGVSNTSTTSIYGRIGQWVENPSSLKDKIVTFSIKISGIQKRLATQGSSQITLDLCWSNNDFEIDSLGVAGLGTIKIDEEGIYSLTTKIPSDVKKLMVRLQSQLFDCAVGNTLDFDIDWIKLEVSPVATPFVPRSYAEELMLCERYNDDDLVVPYSNPNLLINGDFQVWQRGEKFENIASSTQGVYIADRWNYVLEGNAVKSSVSKTDKGMRISFLKGNESTTTNLRYVMEKSQAKQLSGKTVTITVRLSATAYFNFAIASFYGLSFSQSSFFSVEGDGVARDYTFTTPVDYVEQSLNPHIQFVRLTGSPDYVGDIDIEYIKMELGSTVTPFIPRSYTEELRDCQRYYEILPPYSCPCFAYNSVGCNITLSYSEKRVVPTIKVLSSSGTTGLNCFGRDHFNLDRIVGFDALTTFSRSAAGIIDGSYQVVEGLTYYMANEIEIDAELY